METQPVKVDLIRESDRGAVVVGAAILDDALTALLNAVFEVNKVPKRQLERLFDVNGPLSTFASKTLICYSFGLISKTVFDDLNAIRGIRNEFAHTSDVVDFSSPDVVSAVMSLDCVKTAKKGLKATLHTLPKNDMKHDWEVTAKGYVKQAKALLAIGIYHLLIELLEHHHDAIRAAQMMRKSRKNAAEADGAKAPRP